MSETAGARLAARVYAVLLIITGLGMFAAIAVIAAAFGMFKSTNDLMFVGLFSLIGLVLIALGVFVWLRHLWAMIVSLAFSALLAYWLFDPTAYALLALGISPIVFAILTVICIRGRNQVTPA